MQAPPQAGIRNPLVQSVQTVVVQHHQASSSSAAPAAAPTPTLHDGERLEATILDLADARENERPPQPQHQQPQAQQPQQPQPIQHPQHPQHPQQPQLPQPQQPTSSWAYLSDEEMHELCEQVLHGLVAPSLLQRLSRRELVSLLAAQMGQEGKEDGSQASPISPQKVASCTSSQTLSLVSQPLFPEAASPDLSRISELSQENVQLTDLESGASNGNSNSNRMQNPAAKREQVFCGTPPKPRLLPAGSLAAADHALKLDACKQHLMAHAQDHFALSVGPSEAEPEVEQEGRHELEDGAYSEGDDGALVLPIGRPSSYGGGRLPVHAESTWNQHQQQPQHYHHPVPALRLSELPQGKYVRQ